MGIPKLTVSCVRVLQWEKQAVWDALASSMAFYGMDDGFGALIGVVCTEPPVPSAPVAAPGFPRQVTQGKANIGVSIHHRPWGAEARPLHQALIKGEIPLPGCQCGEQASTLRCRRGQDENDAQRLQNPLAKEYTLRDPTTI